MLSNTAKSIFTKLDCCSEFLTLASYSQYFINIDGFYY